MRKNSVEYLAEKQMVLDTYIQPLLDALEETPLARYKKEVLSAIGKHLSCTENTSSFGRKTREEMIEKLQNMQLYKDGKTIFNFKDNEVLYNAYISLALYYLDEYSSDADETDQTIMRRTMVREIIFDILDLFPQLKFINLNTSVINEEKLEPEEDAQNNKSIFTGLPTELQLNITKFFQTNPDTIRNFRAVSKHTYKLQKSIQDAPGNIYFTLGNEIMITRKRKRHEASVLICLTDRLESNELLNATKLSPNKSLNLFASLYDAIEYAHFLKHGGDMFSREANGYIPAILAVSYIGDSKELDSEEEIITINEGTSCSSYMDSQRKVAVSYIPKVEARAVLPLAAICLYGDSNNFSVFRSDFISFRVFGQILNLNKLLCKPDVNLEPNSKCTIM